MNKHIESAFYTDSPEFEKMMKIIINFQNNPIMDFSAEKHHIVPRCYFKRNNLKIDNTKENLVTLPYWEHILVHYYSIECIKDEFKTAMIMATSRLINIKGKLSIQMLEENRDLILKIKKEKISANAMKVYCYENNTIYDSIESASKILKINHTQISNVCKKLAYQTHGLHFCWAENKESFIPLVRHSHMKGKINGKGRKIYCIETSKIYLGTRDVCHQFGWNLNYNSCVYQCCNGKVKQCKGYHFKWA